MKNEVYSYEDYTEKRYLYRDDPTDLSVGLRHIFEKAKKENPDYTEAEFIDFIEECVIPNYQPDWEALPPYEYSYYFDCGVWDGHHIGFEFDNCDDWDRD